MHTIGNFLFVTLRWTYRDRIFHALLGVALLLLLLVPAFSLFSMRQVQELSITLSLSAVSFVLLVLSILLGASSIWRDLERRYSAAVLGLPISRTAYVLGKFAGVALVLASSALLLTLVSVVIITVASLQYPSERPVQWLNLLVALGADTLKYILLAAFALLFSSLSTSFFLPFFGTIAIYLAGSASQDVYEYVTGQYGQGLAAPVRALIKGVYYLLPNLSAFSFELHAIYGLKLPAAGILYTCCYFVVYTAALLALAVWTFSRRELP